MKTTYRLISLVLALTCHSSFAGAWTANAEIEHVELVRAQGFVIKGSFGANNACEDAKLGYVWVAADHPQYDLLYSTVLSAFMAGKKVKAYVHECTEIGWHGGTFNTLTGAGSLYINH